MDVSRRCKFWVFILCFWLENGRAGSYILLDVARGCDCERMVENGVWHAQKQPLEVDSKKKSSHKFYKIYRETYLPESLFFSFLCFLVNFAKFLRPPLLQNTSKWLLPYARNGSKSRHWRVSIKKLFLKILQYSQENTCVGVSS